MSATTTLPKEARLLEGFSSAFTRPTFPRFILLALGAIVCMGRRSVSRILWTVRNCTEGHPSSYHRFFSHARFSLWPLGRMLAAAVLKLVPENKPVFLALDDTTDGNHTGKKVYGKGCWRDSVRSSRKKLLTKWGHKWVVLAVLVTLPFLQRPWALPVLVCLARPPKLDKQEKRRHKTASALGRGMLAAMIHWFPERKFVCLGDFGFGSHDLAYFAHRHRRHLTLIARGRGDMRLFDLPTTANRGRPSRAHKGKRLPLPSDLAKRNRSAWRKQTLRWYGNSKRELSLYSGVGHWYRGMGGGRGGLAEVRWVHTHDAQNDHEDWFYCTDVNWTPRRIIEAFAGRWSLEVTFEEVRAHLGLESTRVRTRESVLRAAPMIFGLFSVVSLIYAELAKKQKKATARQTPCYHKSEPTFSDALYAVRRLIWCGVILKQPIWRPLLRKTTPRFRSLVLSYLAEAA